MDASSAFQDSLPVSSDALLAQLDAWGLAYRLHKHVPLRTVADAKSVEEAMIVPGEAAFRVKNLYLRDRKKRNWLVTLDQDREIDLKELGKTLGAPGLSFGSADRLMEFLGIRPGAVSPLAMITGAKTGVRFVMDAAGQSADMYYMHPLVNDRTVAMSRADTMAFFEHVGVDVVWLENAG
ncbi:MAG: prolyl-tRNA synthetase associated domain-containing protein [Rhodobacteraceae bacterium]|nr:prolyl-tRNA synthetase associated domain-containing protein [Paracoccaceae bacterium]